MLFAYEDYATYLLVKYILLVLIALLQITDTYTTYKAISSGVGKEANPVMVKLFDWFGMLPTLVVKSVVVVAACWYYYTDWAVGVLVIVYIAIAINNIKVIYSAVNDREQSQASSRR